MSIVFFGTTDTGWHCLEEMLKQGLPVRGMVTGLPEFDISYAKDKVRNLRHRSFANFATDYGLPLLTFTRKFEDEIVRTIASWEPQLFVVIGWYHLIPTRVRMLAPLGTVGVHWSLLPQYRGGSPLVWAILQGERETGASLFYLEDKVDVGDVIAQKRVSIDAADDVADLIPRLNAASRELVAENVPLLLRGNAPRWPQSAAQATYFPPRAPEDGRIDWSWPLRRIYDFIRAQTLPYPCAFTFYRGQKIRLVKATLRPQSQRHACVHTHAGEVLGLEKIFVEDELEPRDAGDFFQGEQLTPRSFADARN